MVTRIFASWNQLDGWCVRLRGYGVRRKLACGRSRPYLPDAGDCWAFNCSACDA
jgi:hypothetical protein